MYGDFRCRVFLDASHWTTTKASEIGGRKMIEIALGTGLFLGLNLICSGIIERKHRSIWVLEKHLKTNNFPKTGTNQRIFYVLRPLLVNENFNPWGSDREVSTALLASGSNQALVDFRIKQVVTMLWIQSGVIFWNFLRSLTTDQSAIPMTAALLVTSVPLSGAVQLALVNDRAKRRSQIIDGELAGMLDLLAFSVSAGEPIVGAISRVGRVCDGLIAQLFRKISGQLSEGKSISQCLTEATQSTSSNSFARAMRAIQTAIERGTPLASVLRAQAQDARASTAASHMKAAGKREAAMMIPIVFLILPMIVFITLYPGLRALQLT